MQKQLISEPSPALWYITWESPRGLGGGLDKPRSEFAPQGRAGNGVPASQPIQWSSEFNDTELGLVYYNYRHYNPSDGMSTWEERKVLI